MKIRLPFRHRFSVWFMVGFIIFLIVGAIVFCVCYSDSENYIVVLLISGLILLLIGLIYADRRSLYYAVVESRKIENYSFFGKKLCTDDMQKPVYYAIFSSHLDRFIVFSNEPFSYRGRYVGRYDRHKQIIMLYDEQTIPLLDAEHWNYIGD